MEETQTPILEYFGYLEGMTEHGGPERPIFGKIRYMSSANTKKKLKLERYISRWAEDAPIPKSPP